jgi:hypothetical protein
MPNIMNQWNQKASNFTFIPRNSAIAWNTGNLSDDIVHNFTITQRVDNSPFHAFFGPRDSMDGDSFPNGLSMNQDHLHEINEEIFNVTIGDSIYYLDNMTINRKATWWAKDEIIAGNKENPLFNYKDKLSTDVFWGLVRPGISPNTNNQASFSDSNNFIVAASSGDVKFRSKDINLNFGFEVEDSATFETELDTTIDRCYYSNAYYETMSAIKLKDSKDSNVKDENKFKAVPNPFIHTTSIISVLSTKDYYQLDI